MPNNYRQDFLDDVFCYQYEYANCLAVRDPSQRLVLFAGLFVQA